MARPILLVHGAWHGAWCWAALQAELDRLGVASWAIDLPGHGLSAEPLGDLAADAECVRAALGAIGATTSEDVVLVGHSYGGGVITEAATRHLTAGGTLAHLVYLTAFAVAAGESVGGLSGSLPPAESALGAAISRTDDGTFAIGTLEAATDAFYARCPPHAAAAAYARLSRQSLASLTQAATGDPRATVASTYVVCTEDRAIPPAHERIMAARCTATVELDADHSPFLSAPAATAALLAAISND